MRLIDADALLSGCKLAQEQISYDRQYANAFYSAGGHVSTEWWCIEDMIEDAPTIEPERKKGKWIYGEKSGQDGWYCSECGSFIPWDYDFYGLDNIDFIEDFKTCPFCDSKMVSYTGADMREGEVE